MNLCRKFNALPYNYSKSSGLRDVRFYDHAKFSGIRVDYGEVLYCKTMFNNDCIDEDDFFKCYIVIYICANTRGVV